MTKQAITDLLVKNYNIFIDYINSLTAEEYSFRYAQKWTAGQQLKHIVLCVKPLVQVFGMDKQQIQRTFGSTDKPGLSYDDLLALYEAKLKQTYNTPSKYLPEPVSLEEREILAQTLSKLIQSLCAQIENFTDQELDSLLIPHPLLGNITLREMLYNAISHVQHHQEIAMQNLKHR
jgi:hypothetical protein